MLVSFEVEITANRVESFRQGTLVSSEVERTANRVESFRQGMLVSFEVEITAKITFDIGNTFF